MHANRPYDWLPIAGLLVAVAGVLIWLLLVYAGDRRAMGQIQVERTRVDTSRLTLEEVVALPESAWHSTGGQLVGLLNSDPLWLRATVRNPTAATQNGVLVDGYFFSDEVTVSWRGQDRWLVVQTGESVASVEKALPGREPAVPLSLPPGARQTVYVKVLDHYRPFSRLEWWPDQLAFANANARALLAEGLQFGGLLALLGYNTLLWLRLRMSDIGYYVLYLGCSAAFVLLARGAPGWLGWSYSSPLLELLLTSAMAWSGYFLVQFALAFLDLENLSPWMGGVARGLRIVMLLLAAVALAIPFGKQMLLLNATAAGIGVTHLSLLAIAIVAWQRGSRQARFFVLAFGCLFGVSALVVIAHIWNLPIKDASIRALMVGQSLEMLLLSLAVADRFAQAQQEKATVQAQLLEEAEQRRAVEEAYADELEVEVRERTRDLQAADADKDRMLAVIGHDLRSPLVALTQRAEQTRTGSHAATAAAVGGQMRDFAGQVSAAGRQMLLLIEDIVVWARMRTGTQPGRSVHALNLLIGPVVALHRPAAERRAVALEVSLPEDLIVRTDFVLAQTLARNLVGNAVKFAASRVEVSARITAEGVEVAVRDDGPGLPPSVAARLRGENANDGDGYEGLGLRLSQEIAQQLDVRLSATSRPEGGTEMSLTLPNGRAEGGAT